MRRHHVDKNPKRSMCSTNTKINHLRFIIETPWEFLRYIIETSWEYQVRFSPLIAGRSRPSKYMKS